MKAKEFLSDLMREAWKFVRRNGLSLSEALRVSWRNAKLRLAMKTRIVKFYFQKIDGTIREAYGTLDISRMPAIQGGDSRKSNETVQTYYDTEKEEYRCFKKMNLIRIV